MIKIKSKHLVSGVELESQEILGLIDFARELKTQRKQKISHPYLQGKSLAMLFDKPSLRTRFSFTVAMSELGGMAIDSLSSNRKKEEPEDLARVLNGYCHGVMVRTDKDDFIERMARFSAIPIINGLSDLHHPCQILADLMTLQEAFGSLRGLELAYIGDGNNILHSLVLLACMTGVNIRYCCPTQYQPHPDIIPQAQHRALELKCRIQSFATPVEAVAGAHAVYTDVWTSMGFEKEKEAREKAFEGFQVNEKLMSYASQEAVVMHCLPMERGKEISTTLPDGPSSVIFQQSENRLHIQKALLVGLLGD